MLISLILPTYNEELNLKLLFERLSGMADTMPDDRFEFVFIDDCSQDASPQILRGLEREDERVEVIGFARNCGSHAAVAAGLGHCRGGVAIMLATDLQDPPELCPQLVAEYRKGFNVVWGVRARREGESFITVAMSRLFYFLMNRLTDVAQPSSGADVFLIDRQVIECFKCSPEKNTSVYMLIAWLGFRQTAIEYVKEARNAGESKWNTAKRFKLFFDSLISFSYVPLRFMSVTGVISATLGLMYAMVVLVNALAGVPIAGWSSLMIVLLLLGGFQMVMMGMLGEYLWRTYDETRGRLRFVIAYNSLGRESRSLEPPSTQERLDQS